MYRRSLALLVALAAALLVCSIALAARVHVRVEGKTQTIFGSTAPLLDGGANALTALDAASVAGEFYYHVQTASFGNYVDQIGRYPAGGSSGWVFKVNGALPPVGADAVTLKDGDSVLWYWATFGSGGQGPPTLELLPAGRSCYRVEARDDQGKVVSVAGVVLRVGSRRVPLAGGRTCVGRHPGLLVRAEAPGTVRSNAVR